MLCDAFNRLENLFDVNIVTYQIIMLSILKVVYPTCINTVNITFITAQGIINKNTQA